MSTVAMARSDEELDGPITQRVIGSDVARERRNLEGGQAVQPFAFGP
jgi:hypothetical protein